MRHRIVPSSTGLQTLDSRTLGRPVHLLPRFCEELKLGLDVLLRTLLHRRHAAVFHVSSVTMSPFDDALNRRRWLTCDSSVGRLACSLDRRIVLAALAYRFGLMNQDQAALDDESSRETATEERLTVSLSQQLIRFVAERIDPQCPQLPQIGASDAQAALRDIVPPRAGAWQICVRLHDVQRSSSSDLFLMLDARWAERLLTRLSPQQAPSLRKKGGGQPLAKRMQVRLNARLLQMELSLGDLLGLKVGALLPVSLGDTGVYVDDARLFTAVVAEHRGRLCLTSFQDTD
ncbi:MAG TPA: FliM/FliN family flagellar motor C-terminal domain-containing protein [Burkholderiaceae bacterium]|nr:FliM/FliN family flagellar motor C-terminal domain-containing protein [Burkholderiaceae bacterium]